MFTSDRETKETEDLAPVKWLICWSFFIRTVVRLRLLTGVKERSLPLPRSISPINTRLSPSTTADSQGVLLFCSERRLQRDESLAELNRHPRVTPGYRALSLWSLFFNWRPVLFLEVQIQKESVSEGILGKRMFFFLCLNTSVDVANCFFFSPSAGSSQLLLRKRERRWGR